MTLFLIAHKVRGSPAFDIAEQMECPHCGNMKSLYNAMYKEDCHECNGEGHWWIIPTSGHRAYPYGWVELETLGVHQLPDGNYVWGPLDDGSYCGLLGCPYPDLPDHYPDRHDPGTPQLTGLSRMMRGPVKPLVRRPA